LNFLLDTNVISEWVKPHPNEAVVRWIAEADEDRIYLSAVSIAEISRGVAKMDAGFRRTRLETWLRHDLPLRFEGRIIVLDFAIADCWGSLVEQQRKAGRTLHIMDGFLAATAATRELTLVTPNTRDFAGLGFEVINPWPEDALVQNAARAIAAPAEVQDLLR
jgi:predicted nucleic acid-binding protein